LQGQRSYQDVPLGPPENCPQSMPAFSKKKVLRPLSKVKMPTTDRRSNVFNDRDKKAFTSQSLPDPISILCDEDPTSGTSIVYAVLHVYRVNSPPRILLDLCIVVNFSLRDSPQQVFLRPGCPAFIFEADHIHELIGLDIIIFMGPLDIEVGLVLIA
jgi:hypothetical protein